MINWIPLTTAEQVDNIKVISKDKPCLIFKHSTRCSISSIALHRLENSWDFDEDTIKPYFLDLIAYKGISGQIAEIFKVHHESPQIILIREGASTYDASHLDISVAELKECFEDTF